jgi:hypothetical protein
LKRMLYLLMVAVLLLADSGQTIYAHTCLKTNHTSLALSNGANCCGMKAAEKGALSFNKASCCRVTPTLIKHVAPAKVQLAARINVVIQPVFASDVFKISIPYSSDPSLYIRSSSPEPASAVDISFTQVFRC